MKAKAFLIAVFFLLGNFKVLSQDSSQIYHKSEIGIFNSVPKQDSLKFIILSPRVGEVIDKSEREEYQLFKAFKNFSKVIFYQTAKGEYYGDFFILQSDGTEKDTLAKYNLMSLFNLAERIENWEEIKSGKYKFGINPPQISIKGGEIITLPEYLLIQNKREITQQRFSTPKSFNLPKQKNFMELDSYPKLYVGFGFGSTNQKFDKIINAFKLLEQAFQEKYYNQPVSFYFDNISADPLLNLFFKIEFIKHLSINFEIYNSISRIVFRNAVISLIYDYQPFNNTPFLIYGGAGIGKSSFSIEKKIGLGLSDGGELESFNAEGESNFSSLTGGFQYNLIHSFYINLFGNYMIFPKMKTTIERLEIKTDINLKGFSYGLKFSFGL